MRPLLAANSARGKTAINLSGGATAHARACVTPLPRQLTSLGDKNSSDLSYVITRIVPLALATEKRRTRARDRGKRYLKNSFLRERRNKITYRGSDVLWKKWETRKSRAHDGRLSLRQFRLDEYQNPFTSTPASNMDDMGRVRRGSG